MTHDIEILLLARLLVLWRSEPPETYQNEVSKTLELLDLLKKKKISFQEKDGFLHFCDKQKNAVDILKIIDFEEISSLRPIVRSGRDKLYNWNPDRKNELISRGFSLEEHRRVEFLSPGFYFISSKINKPSEQLFFVTKNHLNGYIKYHKLIDGERQELRQRKNKGKIYQILISENILEEEKEIKLRRLGKNNNFRNRIIHDDCLRVLREVEDKSVDLVIADLPYGKFAKCHWDAKIDLIKFWQQIERIAKPNAAILLFGKEPFSSTLRMSNQSLYRYDIIWIKNNASNFVQGNRMPLNFTETISVFYDRLPTYNPQKIDNPKGAAPTGRKPSRRKTFNELDQHLNETLTRYDRTHSQVYEPDKLLPKNYLFFPNERKGRLHPTQKPLELLKYLIKTFSNEGDTVLDPTCGSGTTCVAAMELGRSFIGIEKEKRYVDIAIQRLSR